MLLIGDIHIHPRYCNTTIDMLRSYTALYPDEKNIIFVGDYVYHFSYHRVSLLALLDFFLELVSADRDVYILAGNHDRLGQHFVYTEAEKILHYNQMSHRIHFITKPCVRELDTQKIIFLPYILNRSAYTPQSDSYSFPLNLDICKASHNPQTHASYLLNTCLADMITQSNTSDGDQELIVIHHYYTAETRFPGLKAQFGYKDLALSPHWMDDTHLRLISGHIHHSFIYKNYLCIGAVRSTSPLETNLLHYLFQYQRGQITAHQIALNPYLTLTIEDNTMITPEVLYDFRKSLQTHARQHSISEYYTICYQDCMLPLERTTITLINNNLGYDTLSETISPILQQTLRETKIKQHLGSLDIILENLIDTNQDFSSGRSDRKILLDTYLEQKFGERKHIYIDTLKELKIHS